MDDFVRAALPGDAEAIGSLHYATRIATYTGLIPQPALDADSRARRVRMWEERLADPAAFSVFVAGGPERLHGLVAGGPMPAREGRAPLPGYDAYLYSLYIDPAAQGRGIGAALLRRLAQRLAAAGSTALAFNVVAGNPARGFYEHLGARYLLDEPMTAAGTSWVHLAYGWPDLRVLL